MEAAFVRRVVRGWAISLALLGAACGPGLPEDVARAEQAVTGIARGALSLPWQGTVSTSFAAGALNSDHTVVVRFMAQYEASLEGPLVADGSGNYVIGMADFNSIGNEGTLIRVGGIQQIYAIPDPVRWTDFGDLSPGTATCPGASWCPVPPAPNARWRTLVVVRSGASISVYRDGVLAGTQLAGVAVASGTLQLGRRPVGAGERKNQFFGLLDDVGVFNRALSAAEVVALSAASALSGTEAGLVAGWSFDDDATEPPVLRQPFTLQGPASVVPISAGREAAADTAP
jgi:hypothetical protein